MEKKILLNKNKILTPFGGVRARVCARAVGRGVRLEWVPVWPEAGSDPCTGGPKASASSKRVG